MKFRAAAVVLFAGGGLALAALPASPVAAQVYTPPVGPGAVGTGSVSKSIVFAGESTVFRGCGYLPGSLVALAVDGTAYRDTTADGTGCFSEPVVLYGRGGIRTLTGAGTGTPTAVPPGSGTGGGQSPGIQIGLTATSQQPLQAGARALTVSASVLVVTIGPDGVEGIPGLGNVNIASIPAWIDFFERHAKNLSGENKNNSNGTGVGLDAGAGGVGGTGGVGGVGGGTGGVGGGAGGGADAGAPAGTSLRGPGRGLAGNATSQQGALPFTGVETGAMASIAVALVGGGVLLRVAARRRRLAGTDRSET